MKNSSQAVNAAALTAKKQLSSQFFKKGLFIALLSGIWYGLYSAFMALAMTKGVWTDWYGENQAALSAFVITYLIGALGSAVNDTCSAVWALSNAAVKGKLGDFFRCIKSKPGVIMIAAALIGGPISSAAYVVGLQMAGSIVIPITALCPAVGAVLGRVLFKQELNKRMVGGIAICVMASFLIGSTSLGGSAPKGMLLGICIASIAALGWGIEGCIAGFGTSMIDYEIGITIRQSVSGLANLFVLVPLFGLIAGDISIAPRLAAQAFASGTSMMFFAVSGLFAFLSFGFWYRGNSMCGAALGMACNGTYSFWGPFFCWIILGVIGGIDGWSIPPVAWVAAVLMIAGILMIAMNPLELLQKKGGVNHYVST